jgi:mono/diheme cytochrome c family protein
VAWDPVAQKARWTVDYDGPWNGGLLATAGNLVFQGSATGEFAAYSADSGKKLWGFDTQTGVVAPAMTYEIDGEQYVALMAGYGGGFAVSAGAGVDPRSEGPRRLLVFKLGAKNKLPARPVSTKTPLTLPATPGTPQQIATGNAVFAANCGVCHGASGVSNFSIPDLRYSPTITDAAIFKSIVIDGDRKEQGMVSFASLVSVDEAESVRQYLLDLSRRQQVMQKAAGK